MLTPEQREQLIDALGEAQRIGMLGPSNLGQSVGQAERLAERVPPETGDFLDVGSGGGLPGLVVALAHPGLRGLLVDRRGKRVDLLTRLVGRLGLRDRVEAVACDVADLPVRKPGMTWPVITARGFGSPSYTLELVVPVLAPEGILLVTEPPGSAGERWVAAVGPHAMTLEAVDQGIAVLRRTR